MTAIADRHTFYANDRGPAVMRVHTDGAMIDIEVGLHDADGRKVTRVDVSIDDAARGGDKEGRTWVRDGARYVRLFPDETGLPGAATPHPPLTMDTVHALSRLANAAQRSTRVRWLTDTDDTIEGTLRHLVQATSDAFPREGDDPRDCRVRITADSGAEYRFPVVDVIARIAVREFGILDR
jgi:hypothetical protein